MTQALATTNGQSGDYGIIERVAVLGDLSPLGPQERVQYYTALCRSLNLNPLTKPFEYLTLDNKLVLYATRGATDQMREARGVSLRIVRREASELGVYLVEVEASTPDGRVDFATGAVAIEKEGGDWQTSQSGKRFFKGNGVWERMRGTDLSNAMMKAETKAKRRATLSICGLGWMDESEVGDVPRAQRVTVDTNTGEILDGPADPRTILLADLRTEAARARALGLDTGLDGRAPREMSNDEIAQALATIRAMIANEAAA